MSAAKQHPFKAIRRAGVSLSWFETADPAATVQGCIKASNGKLAGVPVLVWDCAGGLRGVNEAGAECVKDIQDPEILKYPQSCIAWLLAHLPQGGEVGANGKVPGGVVFFSNLGRFMEDPQVMQAVWNARDVFKGAGVSLVILGPAARVPAELSHDVIVISEELPKAEELGAVVDSICQDAEINKPEGQERERCVNTLLGLSAFEAEQVTALSVTSKGIDLGGLWERKVKAIEATPGLSVWRGGETFEDLGGLANLKGFLRSVLSSKKTPVQAILYIDEIEKQLSGATEGALDGGVSRDQLAVLLTEMQDHDMPGIILVGPPGTGKSSIAKAAGNVTQGPVIACDLGAMKGGTVGQSESQIRSAMKVYRACCQGNGLVIATCNKHVALPPELRRRFALGTFYIDLPTAEEQVKIWPIWMKRREIEPQPLPPCKDWTGSEIRACCDLAYRTGMSLKDAAAFVVPVAKSAADSIEQLRKLAEGKFISASRAGTYQRQPEPAAIMTGRRIEK